MTATAAVLLGFALSPLTAGASWNCESLVSWIRQEWVAKTGVANRIPAWTSTLDVGDLIQVRVSGNRRLQGIVVGNTFERVHLKSTDRFNDSGVQLFSVKHSEISDLQIGSSGNFEALAPEMSAEQIRLARRAILARREFTEETEEALRPVPGASHPGKESEVQLQADIAKHFSVFELAVHVQPAQGGRGAAGIRKFVEAGGIPIAPDGVIHFKKLSEAHALETLLANLRPDSGPVLTFFRLDSEWIQKALQEKGIVEQNSNFIRFDPAWLKKQALNTLPERSSVPQELLGIPYSDFLSPGVALRSLKNRSETVRQIRHDVLGSRNPFFARALPADSAPVFPPGTLDASDFHIRNSSGWTYPHVKVFSDHGQSRVYLTVSSERKVVLLQVSKSRAEAEKMERYRQRHSEIATSIAAHLPVVESADPSGKWLAQYYDEGVSGSEIQRTHASSLPPEYKAPLLQFFYDMKTLHRSDVLTLNLAPENLIWDSKLKIWKVGRLENSDTFYADFDEYLKRDWTVDGISMGASPR